MEFIEAPAFSSYVREYLDDDGYRGLQHRLTLNPDLGDLIPGTGGFRKVRWADKRRGKGRRGGLRIIYYYFPAEQQMYGKDEASDLTAMEKKDLKAAIDAECAAREARRRAR